MSEPPIDLNAGVLAPVDRELTLDQLAVTGQIPAELNGILLRNGPNPFSNTATGRATGSAKATGNDMLSWWVGPSMVHGIAISAGQAQWYRNRWVRTGHFARNANPGLPADPERDHNPNVNIMMHAGRILALGEGGLPFVIDTALDTVGPTTFDGALTTGDGSPTGMTAHAKTDAVTGELCFFRSDWQPPYLRYGILDPTGNLTVDQVIELPEPAMMHDFAVTETRALFLDLNVGYDFEMLQHGAAIPLRWRDDKRTSIGVMPRSGGAVRWVDVEPCFVQHVVNAFEVGLDTIVLDVVRYPIFLRFNDARGAFDPNPLGTLWRYTITLNDGDPAGTSSARVVETQLDDRFIELPRIDDRLIGRSHRFTYAVEQPTDREMRGLIRYDRGKSSDTGNENGAIQRHHIPPGDQNSEPIFVPQADSPPSAATPASADERGWILTCIYRAETDTTDVAIIDADDFSAEPVALIHLPCRIPAGFHGAWHQGGAHR